MSPHGNCIRRADCIQKPAGGSVRVRRRLSGPLSHPETNNQHATPGFNYHKSITRPSPIGPCKLSPALARTGRRVVSSLSRARSHRPKFDASKL